MSNLRGPILDELAATLTAALDPDLVAQISSRLEFNPTPPAIDIYPADPAALAEAAGFGQARDSYELVFTVRARVSTADHTAGQDVLLELMDDDGDQSVTAALEDDQTLNGLAGSVFVELTTGFVQYLDAGGSGSLLGCEWSARVLPVTS